MPCEDLTEVIHLSFDENDRLKEYRLTKRTCGAAVGTASLLAPVLQGLTSQEILALRSGDLAESAGSKEAEFLTMKHLLAVQSATEVLVGLAVAAPNNLCTAVTVTADRSGMQFEGMIAIDAIAAEVRPCV